MEMVLFHFFFTSSKFKEKEQSMLAHLNVSIYFSSSFSLNSTNQMESNNNNNNNDDIKKLHERTS